MDNIVKELQEASVGKVLVNEPLSKHTTIKIGGPADLFIEPDSVESLKKTLEIIKKHGIKWRAIGRGSNLLVSDNGIEGAVIKMGNGLNHMELDGTTLTVGAGYSIVSLAVQIARKGLSGLEFSSGIPGSIGGAVYMNAGAHGSDVSKVLTKAHILFDDGTFEWLSNEEMEYSYRTSILQKKRPGIVVEATFQLTEGDKAEISAVMKKNKEYRRDTQPWDLPCAGSIFRNPLPNYAGQLVEKSGLKGHSIGGAKISEMHGNFIVNAGNAKAQDVLDLIEFVKEKIYTLHGVRMETEVEIIGRI
ncbi:UDP-N-acetylmuramate dehydrogenase [Fredinandcohnia sp. QZ13]|uniref:UDP-N-acetylmuramate dehydrogenase n=1 Tax=Fredinandcohnia sp. QZ13 TaxID=3073144 RepID=UPI0028530788|nr:UDP-N-acetylmuramate dehydrogenase [Fredinandcohnia sp. QZ13]MDR4886588.1 UDP-N-acetylmuramate dehydrogenase [Fredinandcohnia sp. QZ13]